MTAGRVGGLAREKGKPFMIAESTPFGGVTEDTWEEWFVPVIRFIEESDVRLWSYIHCDWDAQSMWKGVGFGDTRLDSSLAVARGWREEVEGGRRFLFDLEGGLQEKRWGEKTVTARRGGAPCIGRGVSTATTGLSVV